MKQKRNAGLNYIRHLTAFFDLVARDKRLNPSHVSVYMALFQSWNLNRFRNPISVCRSETMLISKISARTTYHKVLKELTTFGYIRYKPSYNPLQGSAVYMKDFHTDAPDVSADMTKKQSADEQAAYYYCAKTGTSDEPVLVPSINNTNITNNKTGETPASNDTFPDNNPAAVMRVVRGDQEKIQGLGGAWMFPHRWRKSLHFL